MPDVIFNVIRSLIKKPKVKTPMNETTKKYFTDRLKEKIDYEIIQAKDHNLSTALQLMHDNLVMFDEAPLLFTDYQKMFTTDNFVDLLNFDPINNINLNIDILNALDFP